MPWAVMDKQRLEYTALHWDLSQCEPQADHVPLWCDDGLTRDAMNGVLRVAEMPFHPPYPAIQSRQDIQLLRGFAAAVPPGGVIAESGSYLGGSAKIMLEAADPSVTLHAFDFSWHDNTRWDYHYDRAELQWITHSWGWALPPSVITRLDFASWYLSAHDNVHLRYANVPYDLVDWDQPCDLIFEDSSHENPQLHDIVTFWLPWLRPGGTLAGHDYHNAEWPDVRQEAAAVAAKLGVKLNYTDESNIWWVVKPEER